MFKPPLSDVWPALLLAFALSHAFMWLAARKFRGKWFLDHANDRSLHTGATPKVGGFGLLPAVALSLLFQWILTAGSSAASLHRNALYDQLTWMLCSALIFAICAVNDRSGTELSARSRLFGYLLATLMFFGCMLLWNTRAGDAAGLWNMLPTWRTEHKTLALVLVVGSTLTFINFFNFMDGMDGLAGSMGTIGFTAMGLQAARAQAGAGDGIAISTLCIAATCLAFLLWNWPRARIFMGDTGSTFLGFSAMALGWQGTALALWHWSFPFLLFFPFWFDASYTLLRRLFQGKKIWMAHREHIYQLAVLSNPGQSMATRHRKVLFPAIALMLVSSLIAFAQELGWWVFGQLTPWSAILILGLIHTGIAAIITAMHRQASSGK